MNPLQKQKLNGLLLGSSCLVASVLLGLSPALAGSAARGLPSGGNVVSGNAKIGGHGSKITQTSEKAFIDWNNFSIGAGETVTIKGPNKNAVTVNRVTGVDRSVIDGVLRANDNVWLLNGNGILFGKGSIINVGSLIATTSDLSDDDFRKGKYRFTTGSNPNASVINKGKITAADGGTVVLSAAHVANEGVVKANLGTVVLGGANAFTVDLNGDNLIRYQVTAQVTQAPTDSKGNAQKALVSNSGKIQADGGTVLMTSRAASNVQDNVINNSGMIEATSVSSHNGEVDLDAGTLDTRADGYRKSAGTVDDSGQIDVSGTAKGETGGTVTMTGRNVVVADGARIDAEGYAGGGTVLIGGDFHGSGPLKQAKNVTIGKATINADATHNGDGGKVAIWSRGDTSFDGTVTARGGRDGGDGGYVETSGHELSISDSAHIRTLAADGNAGMWLIDPTSVEICHVSDCCGSFSTSFIDTSVITAGLSGGDVTIEAIGGSPSDITVADAVVDTGSTNTLSLLSEGSIEIDANIQVGGALNLVAGWNGVTGVSSGATTGSSNATVNMGAILSTAGAYGNSGGDITIGSPTSCVSVAVGSKGGTLTVDAEDVFVGPPNAGGRANDQLGYDGTGGGNISVNLLGNLTVESTNGGTSQIGNGDASQENTGATAITGDIALNVAGTTTIAAEGNNTAWIGNVAYTGGTEAGNVTLVTGVLDVTNCGTASGTLLGSMIHADLGSSNSTGGDFTLGLTSVNGDTTVSDYFTAGLSYNSPHTLSLFSENDLVLGASIQNSGSGAINLVAGWNGASTSMATILANDDYGASGGDITLGDPNSGESVAVGSKSGTLTVAAADLFVGPPNGCQTANFQLGYLGSGGGDIDIVLTGDLDIQSDQGGTSRVGNGGASYTGAVTGNITINAANINMNQNNAYGSGEAVIGNYGADAVGGNINITTSGDVLMSSKNGGGTQVSIGNDSYGDVSTTGNVTLNIGGNLSMYATGYATGNGGHDGGTYIGSKSATSNIKVTVAQNITMTVVPLHSYVTHNYVQIGNFGSSASDSQAGGNITVTSTQGNIVMREQSYGGVQIGNTYAHTVSGNIVVTASEGDISMYSNHGATQIGNSAYGGAQVSGNVTVKATQGNIGLYSLGQHALVEIGNGLAVQTSGDITVTAGGAINLQAEYKYATAQIGNNGSSGTTSGNIKVTAGGSISLYSSESYGSGSVTQIGNGGGNMQGNASGNIVVSGSSLSIGSNSVTAYAMIGNGDPLHESKYSRGAGGAYGNISISMTGATVLNGYGGTTAWIGNLADSSSTETGAVTLVTKTLGVETDSNADNTALGDMVASDLTGSVTTGTANQGGTHGGNVTIAITGPHTTDWGEYFGDGLQVPNGNTLALITTAAMEVTTTIENTEGGNIDLIAGWDGTTGVTANGINVSRVLSQHAYGASGGDITIGGSDAGGDVAVGTLFGNTTVAGANVTLSGENGYAQIGYNGANSTGNITVDSTGSVTLSSDTAFTQIGNGGAGTNGNNGGNIVVDATGAIVLDFAVAEDDAYAQIGNGGLDTNDQAGAAGSNSGNVTVTGASVTLTAGAGNNDYVQIGNGGANSNDAAGSDNSGNIKVTTTTGDVTLTGGSQGGSDEQNVYAQIGMGGPFSGASNTKDTGNITVNSAAGVTLTGGTDADQQNGFAVIGDTGTAKKTGDITVTAAGDITVRGGSATGNPDFNGTANSFAQIGDTNSGAITGNLTVTADGSLTIRGGNGDAGDTAWVGNTSSDSNVVGNVSIAVDGTTIIDSYQSADQAGFGNTASGATATGTTLLNTNDLALGSDSYADFGKSLASSLDNGNVTVEIEDKNADTVIAGAAFYDSANTLKILDRGSLHFESNIQNSGNGAIYVVGGWDGTTTNASNFTNTGVYGNNGGSITVGDVVGNVSIGSKSGTTTFAADNIDVDAETGIAQIGWSGIGGGDISVVANGNVTLETAANEECSDCTALIGNGGTGVDGTVTGNISVVTTGGSVSVSALGGYSYHNGNVTYSASSIATIGNLGGQASMRGNVAIDTHGGDLTLVSSGTNSYAQVGSWSTEYGDPGSITSNITVDAGAVSLTANGSGSSADIGNGNYLGKSLNGAITGNITIDATTLSVVTDSSNTDYEEARVGNLGGGVVTGTLDVTTTGNVLVSGSGPGAASIGNFSSEFDNDIGGYDQGEATGTVEVTSGGSITVESNDGYASIELGGAKSGTVDVTAKKNITETATNGGGVLIGSLAIDNGGVNVSVTSKTGNIDLESSGTDSTAQIGTLQDSQDVGGDASGNVSITATQGNITIAANNGGTTQIGNIGDTDTGDSVSGNLTLTAGDVFDIATTGTTIGNTGGLEAGNVAIKAATLQGDISPSIENDLPGGNFNLVLTGDDTLTLSSDIDYNSAHNLTLSNGGDIDFTGAILNEGSGDITVNAGGTVTIGGAGATGDVEVGSLTGTTTVTAGSLVISGKNGDAALGYVDQSGNVILTAGSVSASGHAEIVGLTADITVDAGNFGSAAHPVELLVGALALNSAGGSAYITAPDSISIGVGSDGIDLDGGDLVLSSDGAVTQTQAIAANSIDISGTSITLTNAGNSFGDATLSSSGNAKLHDASDLTIDSADVGGALTLSSGGNIGQSGAITANALNVTAGNGAITLTNTANSFGDATLTASGNASLYDAADLTVDGADVGGKLALTGGGNIGQSGAITASTLDVTANHGKITLTNTGNAFADADLTASGNASLYDASDLKITGADVGGTLTLTGGGNIGQSGAITASTLDVTANQGKITLTNTGNAFADADLTGSGNASLYDAADLTVDGANVGGTLTLSGGGNIGQSGAITAGALDVTANHGTITLTNTDNAFADADLTASGNASLYDASALTITGADVGGTLKLTGGGNIGQSGAIVADALKVTASNGSITLANTANSFGDATLAASGNASLYDAADLTIDGANVGGTLTLTGGGNIGQSSAITASTLDVTANHGKITLTNTGNAFAGADLTASGNASLYDASALTITGADVGGTLTLTGGGNIGQSGAIVADALKATASNGSITLANTGNSFGDATLAASGNASLYDAADLTIDSADVGGALTLSGGGDIGQSGAITAASLNVTASDGSIALTNTANSFGDATLAASGNASLSDAADLTIDGANVGGTLTLTGGGDIGQSGAITAGTLDVVANHGVIALTNTGNSIGDADLTSSGKASLYDASDLIIDGANVGGKLTLSGGGNIGQSGAIDAGTLSVTAKHGSIALTDADNDVTTASLSAHGDVALYDSVDLTVKSADAGGNLTLLTQGNLTFVSSVQLQNGDLLAVAGWDGTTTNPSDLATRGAYGNNGGSITVGGKNAAGDVAIGSANGSTTLAAANVTLDGENGYAQIGYHGAGSGDIDVVASRDVTLTGGTGAGDYAQIGNGGMGTSGDESGNITVDAVGAVALDGGDGKDAYAQIGHGGADADKNSHGYTNSGTIDVKGQTVALLAGAGDESYAQIGHGGFDLGDGLTGQGVNSGNITITAVDAVSLTGNGTDAYTQIGNGGDQVNANAGSSAGGSNSGDIVVAAGAGISMIAGASDDAYAQIGNGGFGTNASGDADPSNFTDSGTITVSDLVLTGSDTGKDAYAQIGNGDASGTGIGDVSGNITIDAGSITVHSGSATGANAAIGNATGKGTVSGTVAGYTAPSTNNNSTQGVVTSIVSQTSQANVQQVSLVVVNPPENQQTSIISDTGVSEQSGPLGQLSGDKEGSGNQASDDATDALGQSLGGHRHNVQTVALIPGVLTEVVNTQTAHGIPPADQNFSSWGNEALWRW